MVTVPIRSDLSARFEQTMNLNGKTWKIYLHWNGIENCWFMDLFYRNELIIAGVKLVVGIRLTLGFDLEEDLKGDFIMYDSERRNDGIEPDLETLGDRFFLIFLTEDELNGFQT